MAVVRVVIFDLDNTLVINKPAAKAGYEAAIRYLANQTKSDFTKFYAHWKKIVQQLKSEHEPNKRAFEYSLRELIKTHHLADTYLPQTLKIFEKELITNLKPMPGAKEILSWLKDQKCLVTVATGSERTIAKKKLKSCGLYDSIDYIVSSSDVGKMKPSTDYYLPIALKYHAKPKDILVISDSKMEDINPAKTLGYQTILVSPVNLQLTSLKNQLSTFLTYAE